MKFKNKCRILKYQTEGGILMTRKERSDFEKSLFKNINNKEILNAVRAVKERSELSLKADETHRMKFAIRYCDVLLNSMGNAIGYKNILSETNEATTTYYFYRNLVLDDIHKEIQMRRA